MRMKTRYAILFLAAAFAIPARAQQSNPASAQKPVFPSANPPSAQQEDDKLGEAYYNYTLGHYYQQEYGVSSRSEDANKAIDFYKKAFELDPSSAVIGEQLAEIYFQTQRIRDAVLEAQSLIAKDPNNLAARRLLARIYVRSLGDTAETSGQRETLARAVEQYQAILRINPNDDDAALWLSRLYRMQNEHDKAEEVLRNLINREPENENAAGQLTQLLLDEGKSQDAINLLQGILKRAPTGQLYDLLGDAYTQSHDEADAETAYRKAMDLEPDEMDHRRGLAQSLLAEQKYKEALQQYQRIVAMDADDPDTYVRLAEIYRQLHDYNKAEQNILLAKQRAPGSLEVIYYEASIYAAEGRLDDAIRVTSDAVTGVKSQSEFTPSRRRTLAILYQQLGELYREAGNYPAAVNSFNEMLTLGPEEDHRARLMIIETYRTARDVPHALDAAKQALQTYPHDRAVLTAQALLYGENAQTDQAVAVLNPLLAGNTTDFEIQLDLAQVYEQGRRWTDAEAAVHTAEKLVSQPSDGNTTGFLLGAIYERQKKFDLAEDAFRKVLAADPHNAPVLNYYGYMLADRGVRLEEATDLIKRALAEDANNPAYLDSLGWAYFHQNKLDEAEEMLRKAVSRDGHDPTILSHLGDVYAKAGKTDLAAAQWEKSVAEWHLTPPGDLEPDKLAEVETKIAALKRRVAQQQKPPGDTKPQ